MSAKNLMLVLALLGTTGLVTPAVAEEDRPDFTKSKLTGSWGGVRDRLYDSGVTFDMYYKLDVWENTTGGLTRGSKWNDNLDMIVGLDGEKLIGFSGLSSEIYFINNNGLRPNDRVGSHGGIDNIEVADGAPRLYTAWVQQNFRNDFVSVKLGLYDLNTEFYVTDASGLFINPTYGIGTEMAATGDNGPSVFPQASLAARVLVSPTESTYLQAAILDGVPGDPNNPDATEVEFENKDGALLVGEAGYRHDDYGHYGFGVWEYTAKRPDQLSGTPEHSRGFYFLAEKAVYTDGDKKIDLFGRLGFTAAEVEQFDHAWAAGAVFGGFVPTRPEGQIGIGVSAASNGSRYKTANAPVDDQETQLELTYADQILPWLAIQPDLQYTVNPGTTPGVSNALTAGIRFGVDF